MRQKDKFFRLSLTLLLKKSIDPDSSKNLHGICKLSTASHSPQPKKQSGNLGDPVYYYRLIFEKVAEEFSDFKLREKQGN